MHFSQQCYSGDSKFGQLCNSKVIANFADRSLCSVDKLNSNLMHLSFTAAVRENWITICGSMWQWLCLK